MNDRKLEIFENIAQVKERMRLACEKSHRDLSEVTLIAVSKTKPVEDILYAAEAGMTCFGENKVQELTMKMDMLSNPFQWNMIGHLQKNKVKYIVGRTALIHSVDSVDLAAKIQNESEKRQVHTDILIEVNVSGEESKFGVTVDALPQIIEKIAMFSNVHIKGLMTIAPFTDNPEDNRPYFRKLRNLAVDIKSKNIDNVTMSVLSMGMTGDYEVAIEEGATMIRVGTGIFGERNYLS